MKTENIPFAALNIHAADIEKVMGFEPGNAPAPFSGLIETGISIAGKISEITGGYKIFRNVSINETESTVSVDQQVFNTGTTITPQLNHATGIAVHLCTAGSGFSGYLSGSSLEDNDLLPYIIDLIGSVTVKKASEYILKILRSEALKSNLGTTTTFSPGFSSWDISEQQKLFMLLPPRFCNITLSESHLMHPVKSVSGITGIGTDCKNIGNQCDWCNNNNCYLSN